MELCDSGWNCIRARWNFVMVARIFWGKVELCDGGQNCMGAMWNFVTVAGIVWAQDGIL